MEEKIKQIRLIVTRRLGMTLDDFNTQTRKGEYMWLRRVAAVLSVIFLEENYSDICNASGIKRCLIYHHIKELKKTIQTNSRARWFILATINDVRAALGEDKHIPIGYLLGITEDDLKGVEHGSGIHSGIYRGGDRVRCKYRINYYHDATVIKPLPLSAVFPYSSYMSANKSGYLVMDGEGHKRFATEEMLNPLTRK